MEKTLRLSARNTGNTNNLKRMLFTFMASALFAVALILSSVATARAGIAPPAYTVDTTADDAGLTACTDTPNDCSLRGAITSASSGAVINFDSTVFASAQTITLNGTELVIGKSLTITGTGANLLTIDANFASRIFSITSSFTVILENMTIINGRRTAANGSTATRRGGAIYNISGGNITLNNMIISGNQANLGGGAIFTTGTTSVINVNNSTVSGNTAITGGGLNSTAAAPVRITNSTIIGNTATTGYGGGISKNYSATTMVYSLIIKNSTVSNNASNTNAVAGNFDGGGGIFILTNGADNTSQTLIQNSTISGNSSTNFGGGVFIQGSAADFINSTVTNNTSNSASGGEIP